jgi:hypothetical protein
MNVHNTIDRAPKKPKLVRTSNQAIMDGNPPTLYDNASRKADFDYVLNLFKSNTKNYNECIIPLSKP